MSPASSGTPGSSLLGTSVKTSANSSLIFSFTITKKEKEKRGRGESLQVLSPQTVLENANRRKVRVVFGD